MRIQDADMAWRVFSNLLYTRSVMYIQQFLPHQGYDVRILFIGGQSFAMRRYAKESEWKTNVSQGAHVEAYEPTETELALARRSAQAVHGTVVGVDLLPCQDGTHSSPRGQRAVPGWRGCFARQLESTSQLKSSNFAAQRKQPKELDLTQPSPNIASRLRVIAEQQPTQVALARPVGKYVPGVHRAYSEMSFAELELHTSSIAAGLQEMGIEPGMRIVMLVPFGDDFISLVFALLKVGAVVVLIDPGMGRRNLLKCLEESEPDGFIAIPAAQAVRMAMRSKFPKARFNVTVGSRFGFLPKPTLSALAGTPSSLYTAPNVDLESPAADHFYDRQHWTSQRRSLHTSHFQQPSGRVIGALCDRPWRQRFVWLSLVWPLQRGNGMYDCHSRHESYEARRR